MSEPSASAVSSTPISGASGGPSRVRQATRDPFDAESASDDWPQYEGRMMCYFEAEGVSNESKLCFCRPRAQKPANC